MAIPYTLAFPGVFEPGRSLIGGLQSTPRLYILRHCGFAVFLLSAFALLNATGSIAQRWQRDVNQTILLSVAITTAVVLAMAFVCIAGEARLPIIIGDRFRFDLLANSLVLVVLLAEISKLYARAFCSRCELNTRARGADCDR
jgi:hypothetical protein